MYMRKPERADRAKLKIKYQLLDVDCCDSHNMPRKIKSKLILMKNGSSYFPFDLISFWSEFVSEIECLKIRVQVSKFCLKTCT